jgi:hypothetical protein
VSDAFVTIHDDGFAAQHRQNIALWADHGASSAPNAIRGVNMRMLRLGARGVQLSLFRRGPRLRLSFFQPLLVQHHWDDNNYGAEAVEHNTHHSL